MIRLEICNCKKLEEDVSVLTTDQKVACSNHVAHA